MQELKEPVGLPALSRNENTAVSTAARAFRAGISLQQRVTFLRRVFPVFPRLTTDLPYMQPV